MPSYQKLVRDNIPAIIKKNGEDPVTRILSEDEYKQALADKLKEEAEEVAEEADRESVRQELADVLEVVDALADIWDIDQKAMKEYQQDKRQKRGGFKDRVYLEDVGAAN